MTIDDITTPAYIIDENILVHNLEILKYVEDKTGCKILLAQKAFSAFYEYPLIGRYISGTTASGLYEARLGREEMSVYTVLTNFSISIQANISIPLA